jgi:hypothetical protein
MPTRVKGKICGGTLRAEDRGKCPCDVTKPFRTQFSFDRPLQRRSSPGAQRLRRRQSMNECNGGTTTAIPAQPRFDSAQLTTRKTAWLRPYHRNEV